jgi:predicted peptidase
MTMINRFLGFVPNQQYAYIENKVEGAKKLLCSLHGLGECGDGSTELHKVTNLGVMKLVKEGSWKRTEFTVVAPQQKKPVAPAKTTKFYHATLYKYLVAMCKHYGIAFDQIYLLGVSMGAISAYEFMLYLKKLNAEAKAMDADAPQLVVRAVVCIAGDGKEELAKELIPAKFYATHGETDKTTPAKFSQLAVENYNKANPKYPAIYREFPFEGHSAYVWNTTCKQTSIYDWMLKE